MILLAKLRDFPYERDDSFRGWLRTVLRNKWREIQRLKTRRVNGGRPATSQSDEGRGSASFTGIAHKSHKSHWSHKAEPFPRLHRRPLTSAAPTFAGNARPAVAALRALHGRR